jgi:ankyrin repeat protein
MHGKIFMKQVSLLYLLLLFSTVATGILIAGGSEDLMRDFLEYEKNVILDEFTLSEEMAEQALEQSAIILTAEEREELLRLLKQRVLLNARIEGRDGRLLQEAVRLLLRQNETELFSSVVDFQRSLDKLRQKDSEYRIIREKLVPLLEQELCQVNEKIERIMGHKGLSYYQKLMIGGAAGAAVGLGTAMYARVRSGARPGSDDSVRSSGLRAKAARFWEMVTAPFKKESSFFSGGSAGSVMPVPVSTIKIKVLKKLADQSPTLPSNPLPSSQDDLMCAIEKKLVVEIKRLITSGGVDLNKGDSQDRLALLEAIKKGDRDIIELLINLGADVNVKNRLGMTPLHYALVNISKIKAKRSCGVVDPQPQESNATIKAKERSLSNEDNNHEAIVMRLLTAGAHADCSDLGEEMLILLREILQKVLLKAIKNNNIEAVKSVLKFNKDSLNVMNETTGDTPLHLALKVQGNKEMINLLLDYKPNLNIGNKCGDTPMHLITINFSEDSEKLAERMLKLGANINAVNNNGDTPGHTAAEMGNKGLEQFFERNADKRIINNQGKTVYDLLKGRKNLENEQVREDAVFAQSMQGQG